LPASVRRKQELEREDLNRYKTLGRLLNGLAGVVVTRRVEGEGQGYCLRYGLNGAGASQTRTKNLKESTGMNPPSRLRRNRSQ
jgi:hypothetical protein